MTILAPDPPGVGPPADADGLEIKPLGSLSEDDRPTADVQEPGSKDGDERPPVRASLVAVSAALASLSAAWMVTRLFRGVLPVLVAVVGIAIGTGLVYLSSRLTRSDTLQFAVLPAALVMGAILASTSSKTSASLPSLVVDAVRGGGLRQPPIPFDPGWQLIMVVLFAFLSATSCSMAISLARPKLALAVALPVALGAALIQPKGSEIIASAVAIVFIVAALAVAYGADLATEGVVGGGFEVRRLARGAALLTVVIVALVALAQTDFLFPDTKKDQVIPPQKPPSPPPQKDRELFTTKSERPGPWRVGVLDVYGQNAFLLPPVDPKRLVDVPSGGRIAPSVGPTVKVTFHIVDVKGQTLPALANQTKISGLSSKLKYDPRTQLFRLAEKSVPPGATYTVEAPEPADAKALAVSPQPVSAIAKPFTALPPPPPGVQELLARAPQTNSFDRLQFVRQALYTKVVASGAGRPVDILPKRVDAMLAGGQATPFEISAAEVMLARWAGIPARLGFGYFGGDKIDGGFSFRPKHGAAWLEAYFEGHGWIPIIGTPPKAKPSLSNEEKNKKPDVVPTDELALTIYVAVERTNIQLLYEIVRYYVSFGLPIILAVIALIIGYPAGFKILRRRKRRRWASAIGPRARIVVAYAELRDKCFDLNIGDPRHTPLEFFTAIADDDEHDELCWLVTRVLWGDLARDIRTEDVEAAEAMSLSVTRRVSRDQTGLNRMLAWSSRMSLRDPWTDEVPNLWPRRRHPLQAVTRRLRRLVPRRPGRLRLRRTAAA